jgi:hypothetical protein
MIAWFVVPEWKRYFFERKIGESVAARNPTINNR